MTEPEPITFDANGTPTYWSAIGDRLDDETRRRLLAAIDEDQA